MKNKKILYLLIPATLIVWGLIIFKIVNNLNPGIDPVFRQKETVLKTDETVNDTFSIHGDYRDPFLGRMMQSQDIDAETTAGKHPVPSHQPVTKALLSWPSIVYNGIIKKQSSNKEMILLEINGQGHTLKVGQTVDGIQLMKAFRDSIEVSFSKEKKTIHK